MNINYLLCEFQTLTTVLDSLLEEIHEGRVTDDNSDTIFNLLSPLVYHAHESIRTFTSTKNTNNEKEEK